MKRMRKTIRIAVIGYGSRVSGMVREMGKMDPEFRIAAIADPRAAEIRDQRRRELRQAVFYEDADEMLGADRYDGVMIGTRCNLHSRMACKVAPCDVPLFLEKPVGITYSDLRNLTKSFRNVTAPVVVSFPLRVSPIVDRVRGILASGRFGSVNHVVAFNDVPYGEVYYAGWYRNYDETGGLFLQKATHDLDYLTHILGSRPKRVCAMKTRRIYGGSKPFGLMCKDCRERKKCSESPFNSRSLLTPGGRKAWAPYRYCVFAKGIRHEDAGNCIVEYENGVQVSYTQNFYARRKAARRGARFHAHFGTIEFDWYTNKILLMPHDRDELEAIDMAGGAAHFGGDAVLCRDFLAAVRERKPSRAPLEAGILSALTCLKARESAETGRFREIKLD